MTQLDAIDLSVAIAGVIATAWVGKLVISVVKDALR